jgi:hypothetical protein
MPTVLELQVSTLYKDFTDILFLNNKARCTASQPQYPEFEWLLVLSCHRHKQISFQRGFSNLGDITFRYMPLPYVHYSNSWKIVKYGYEVQIEQVLMKEKPTKMHFGGFFFHQRLKMHGPSCKIEQVPSRGKRLTCIREAAG